LKRSSQKLGEKRFRALQTDKDAPCSAASRCRRRSRTTPTCERRHGNEHDYLHIFFHPDCDRRLWLLTRSADPAAAFGRLKTALLRALAGSPACAFALPAYRRWGISPRPEDALIAGRTGGPSIQQSRANRSATPTARTGFTSGRHTCGAFDQTGAASRDVSCCAGTSQRGGVSAFSVTRNARASVSPGLRRLCG